MKTSTGIAIVLTASLLGGCGFQLRSAQVLPEGIDSVFIDASNEASEELRVFFESAGTEIVESRVAAGAVLAVKDERYDRRVLSVDPNTGKESEFELIYQATFGLTGTDGWSWDAPFEYTRERRAAMLELQAACNNGPEGRE